MDRMNVVQDDESLEEAHYFKYVGSQAVADGGYES